MKLRPINTEKRTEVNITPLIDVVFLLLIFFMVSTTFNRESELQIDLPKAQVGAKEAAEQLMEVIVGEDGSYVVRGKALPDRHPSTLRTAVAEAVGENTDQPLVIRADAETPHQAVVTVMDVARQLGIAKLTFATQLSGE